jgi:predicted RNA binding protein YcfA (HicA-like mRNA interferase family)
MPKVSGVHHKRAVKAFEKVGFKVIRQGKHISMSKNNIIIIIPRANPVNGFTMAGIIRDSGLTIEEFNKLL